MTSQSVGDSLIKILPELSNMSAHRSEKCNTILQVKEQKNGPDDMRLHIHESDETNEVRYDCEEKERQAKVYEIEFPVHNINERSPDAKTNITCHKIENSSSDFDEDAISHYIFGNFKNKKLPTAHSEDIAFTPQILTREGTSDYLSLSPNKFEPIRSDDTTENNKNSVKKNMSVQVPPPIEPSLHELADSSPEGPESNEDSLCSFIFGTLKKEIIQNVSPVGPEPVRFDSVRSEENYESITFIDADSTCKDTYKNDGNLSQFTETNDQDIEQYLLKGNSATTSSFPDHISREPKGKQFHIDNFLSSSHLRYGENAKVPCKQDNPELDILELKKMVLKLQNQLNQFQGNLMSVSPKSSHQEQKFSIKSQVSHIPYSTEVTTSKSEMISTLYKPTKCVNHSQRVNDCNQNCYTVQCSCSPNSCPYTSSDLSIKSHNMLENAKKRSDAKSRRVLPVKGGTPFIICDKCSKLLQLPAGFLLSGKKMHLLKCGSCSYVLKFSFLTGYRYTCTG